MTKKKCVYCSSENYECWVSNYSSHEKSKTHEENYRRYDERVRRE